MTLTHEQIAAMTCEEVNKAIAERRGVYVEHVGYRSPEYCERWEYAGRLLEMMAKTRPPETYTPSLGCDRHGVWDCYAYISENKRDDPVSQEALTAPRSHRPLLAGMVGGDA